MENLSDIVIHSNILYNARTKTLEALPADGVFETIVEPVIMMDTLHSCFSHAIMDSCFPIFWILQDLIQAGTIADTNVRIYIRDDNILKFPKQNMPIIDVEGQTYKGVYKDIIQLITRLPILFQHTLRKNYLFQTCIVYPTHDRWQRTPWNCVEYYPGRNVPRREIRFPDAVIYEKLRQFRTHVLTSVHADVTPTNALVIVDRKHNRKIDPSRLQCLVHEAKQNRRWTFTGVVLVEDMSFQEQVTLFASHRIFLFRHGSCLIHLLWIPQNSIVIELEGGPDGVKSPKVLPRLCALTDSKHILVNYATYSCKRDIFDRL